MLVLLRKADEEIQIHAPDGTVIRILVVGFKGPGREVRLGVTAPLEYGIWRKELVDAAAVEGGAK